MEIFGSQGKITFAAFDKIPVVLETANGIQEFELAPPVHIQQPFIQTIVEELTGQGECPSTGVTAARTAWVMDQIVGR